MRKMEPCGAFRDQKYLKETSNRKSKLHEKNNYEENEKCKCTAPYIFI